ncbi:serine/threonine-protein kinase [Picosynechococcus sp. PCC 7002]|uniref:serine/threonine-protein kinase n=1 Tax=Picosynechococcus sp. (strain ATCC 27264 / PCC 7002 / PR-6) TaxID=32049 RepID=UPI0030DC8F14
MIGQLLDGRYRIVKSLAAGGFGQTFIAEDIKQFNKPCVVKQFKPSFSDPEALKVARRLFEVEAQLLNRLGDHDQIPHLLAYFEINQEFFLVQDFVEGHSLEREITVGKKLSEAYAIALLKSILEPLSFIHSQNVIHRDIKPANLIRRKQDGKIVLIDFGAVKELAGTQINAQGQTRVGTIIGTPGYMANEQGRGKPKLSSDIYATGLIIIQALTGKLPPHGLSQWRRALRRSPNCRDSLASGCPGESRICGDPRPNDLFRFSQSLPIGHGRKSCSPIPDGGCPTRRQASH